MEASCDEIAFERVARYYLALRQLTKTQSQYASNFNAFSRWAMPQRVKWTLYLENRPDLPLARALKVEMIKQRLNGVL